MEITEVRIKLMDEDSGERLKAFCSITFDDCFVVRDLKIIEGASGPFVAMPSRKLTAHCSQCGCKNHLRAVHCNQCGARLIPPNITKDDDGRAKLYADIAHPINSLCREMIQRRIIDEFQVEQNAAKQDGYRSRYEDLDSEYAIAQPEPTQPNPTQPEESQSEESQSEVAHPTPAQAEHPESSGTHKKFQPPEKKPRGPHTPGQTSNPPPSAGSSGFGDGVF